MNFLGHLFFSNDDPALMHANLYGDFVKGRDLSHFPKLIQNGIELHREIDHFIDNHPSVRTMMHELYASLPKVSAVAIDLFYDHVLAIEWTNYRADTLEEFSNNFYQCDPTTLYSFSEQYLYMFMRMKNSDWLSNYKSLQGLEYACKGVSQRINFPNQLKYGRIVYEQNESRIKESFHEFMSDAVPHFKTFHKRKL